jgi:NAD(P)-dependent dehydrogenase (short-subunit alcohol dehydrogenase family)
MSKVAALEWGRHGIRVNVVCPFAESDGVKLWRELAPEDYENAVKKVPLQRIGDPVRTSALWSPFCSVTTPPSSRRRRSTWAAAPAASVDPPPLVAWAGLSQATSFG